MVDLIINGGSQTLDGTKIYGNVTITNGGVLYITPYNGTGTTGTLALYATNVTVDSTSSINGNLSGYRGGGGGSGGSYDTHPGSAGGSGEVGSFGTSGSGGGYQASQAPSGIAGTYGPAVQMGIRMGNGAGGGGGGWVDNCWGNPGIAGGAGGGQLKINSINITIHGTITMTGGAGGSGGYASCGYSPGGSGGDGVGGTIWLNGTTVDISNSTLTTYAPGQSGGIAIQYNSLNNTNVTLTKYSYYTEVTTGMVSDIVDLTINGGSQTMDGTKLYNNVTITNGGVLYITAYNGTGTTGTLNLNIANTLTIDSTSSINGNLRGYRGGAGGGVPGDGGAGEVGSFGTAGGGGGRGNHSFPYTGSTGVNGTYGTAVQNGARMGNGAGGGGGGDPYACWANPGSTGQAGGGLLIINAKTMIIHGTITMTGGLGGAGGYSSCYGPGGPGGNGVGGTIWLNGTTIDISNSILTTYGPGQSGGIAIQYYTLNTTGSTLTQYSYYTEQIGGAANFSSSPSGANIWIDDVNIGQTTPYTYSGAPGSHTYRLIKAGYTMRGNFTIISGNTINISQTLAVVGLNGSTWIEDQYLCYINANNMVTYLLGVNSGNVAGLTGSAWIEGIQLAYIDQSNIKRLLPATSLSSVTGLNGSLWVDGNYLYYIASGIQRYVTL